MPERQADEGAAGIRVGVRRPLALQVRLEEESLRARLPALRLGEQLLVRRVAEGVVQPLQRARGREHHAHRVPGARNRVAEDVQPRLGLGPVFGQRGEDDAGRAENDGERARPVDADAERSRSLVARCADRRALVRRRQPLGRQLERLEHLVAPAAVRDVEEERARRVRDVDRALARQPQPDVVLRQQDVRDPRIRLGLVVPQPEELRRREAGQRAVPGQLDQPLEADALLDLGALGRGALVVPEDRRAQHLLVLVERDEAVHLAGEADRRGLDVEVGERGLGRAPPVLRILLGPAGPGDRERVLALCATDDLALSESARVP